MFLRAIGRRYYSKPKALQLWVKHNGTQPTKVSTKNCIDIDDFAKQVQRELDTNCRVALFTSLEKNALQPDVKIKELLKTELKNNTDDTPLFVKLIPTTQDQSTAKTIYIRGTDDDGELKDEYLRVTVRNKEELRVLYNDGKGLIHLDDPKTVLLGFDEVEHGKKYQVYN